MASAARGVWRRISTARGGEETGSTCNASSLTWFNHSAQTSCDSKCPSSLSADASAACASQPPFQCVLGSCAHARPCARRALRAALLLAFSMATRCATPPGAPRHPLRLAVSPALPGVPQLMHNRRTLSARPASARHSTLMRAESENSQHQCRRAGSRNLLFQRPTIATASGCAGARVIPVQNARCRPPQEGRTRGGRSASASASSFDQLIVRPGSTIDRLRSKRRAPPYAVAFRAARRALRRPPPRAHLAPGLYAAPRRQRRAKDAE